MLILRLLAAASCFVTFLIHYGQPPLQTLVGQRFTGSLAATTTTCMACIGLVTSDSILTTASSAANSIYTTSTSFIVSMTERAVKGSKVEITATNVNYKLQRVKPLVELHELEPGCPYNIRPVQPFCAAVYNSSESSSRHLRHTYGVEDTKPVTAELESHGKCGWPSPDQKDTADGLEHMGTIHIAPSAVGNIKDQVNSWIYLTQLMSGAPDPTSLTCDSSHKTHSSDHTNSSTITETNLTAFPPTSTQSTTLHNTRLSLQCAMTDYGRDLEDRLVSTRDIFGEKFVDTKYETRDELNRLSVTSEETSLDSNLHRVEGRAVDSEFEEQLPERTPIPLSTDETVIPGHTTSTAYDRQIDLGIDDSSESGKPAEQALSTHFLVERDARNRWAVAFRYMRLHSIVTTAVIIIILGMFYVIANLWSCLQKSRQEIRNLTASNDEATSKSTEIKSGLEARIAVLTTEVAAQQKLAQTAQQDRALMIVVLSKLRKGKIEVDEKLKTSEAACKAIIDESSRTTSTINASLLATQTELDNKRTELLEKVTELATKQAELDRKDADLETKDAHFEEARTNIAADVATIQAMATEMAELKTLLSTVAETRQKIQEKMDKAIRDHRADLAINNKTFEEFKEAKTEIVSHLAVLHKRNIELKKVITELKQAHLNDKVPLEAKIARLKANLGTMENVLQKNTEEASRLAECLRGTMATNVELSARLSLLDSTHLTLLEERRTHIEDLEAELETARGEIEFFKAQKMAVALTAVPSTLDLNSLESDSSPNGAQEQGSNAEGENGISEHYSQPPFQSRRPFDSIHASNKQPGPSAPSEALTQGKGKAKAKAYAPHAQAHKRAKATFLNELGTEKTADARSSKHCWHWRRGACRNENCSWAHPIEWKGCDAPRGSSKSRKTNDSAPTLCPQMLEANGSIPNVPSSSMSALLNREKQPVAEVDEAQSSESLMDREMEQLRLEEAQHALPPDPGFARHEREHRERRKNWMPEVSDDVRAPPPKPKRRR